MWALSLSALSTLTGVYEAFVRIHPCLPSHQSEWLPQGYKLPSSDLLVAITDNAQHLETVRKKLRDNCDAGKVIETRSFTKLNAVCLGYENLKVNSFSPRNL